MFRIRATLAVSVFAGATFAVAQPGDALKNAREAVEKAVRHEVQSVLTGRLSYPPTRKDESVVDDYHGTKVPDPYRWLEDDNSEETKAWVRAQNEVTFAYLESIPERSAIRETMTALWDYEKHGMPGREGGKYFWSYNTGLQNQSVLFVGDRPNEGGRVLIDPNEWSKDGTVALGATDVTKDGRYLAYAVQERGSDWSYVKVRDIATGQDLPDRIDWVKFSGPSWLNDGSGFFYSRYDAPKEGDALKGANYYQKLYFHTLGKPQDNDALVYERADEKEWGFGGGVTDDGKYLIVSVWKGTDRKNRVFYRDLTAHPIGAKPTAACGAIRAVEGRIRALNEKIEAGEAALAGQAEALRAERAKLVASNGNHRDGFVELLNDFDASYSFIDNVGTVFYFLTDLDAPKSRVIAIDTAAPARSNWKEVIPQREENLRGVSLVGDRFFASYLKDARTQVRVHGLSGAHERDVDLPGPGSAGGFGGKRTDTDTYYSFTSYTTPASVYRYDIKTGTSTLHKAPKVAFDPSKYTTTQVFYTSKDGTKVPMFITHKAGITLDGSHPTLLYGYGGFNIPLTPGFSPVSATWLEMGGVYAVANIRGGGEYGEKWHKAGTKLTKQNVFDDFIAAAEYLVAQKYTKPAKLAIQGGSNGGLLVGAVTNQRPDLFGAALPAVGVMDMLRFHKFTIGWAWTSDYGSSENPEEFRALYAYSPLHTLKPGTCYPAVMVTTADHDDRVVPAHSFKYAAAIQAAQGCDKPVLIRIDISAGHGGGKPTAKRIEDAADQFAFLVKNLGMNVRFK